MTAKQIFAAIGILLGILSFVFTGAPLLAGAVIAVGVAVLVP